MVWMLLMERMENGMDTPHGANGEWDGHSSWSEWRMVWMLLMERMAWTLAHGANGVEGMHHFMERMVWMFAHGANGMNLMERIQRLVTSHSVLKN